MLESVLLHVDVNCVLQALFAPVLFQTNIPLLGFLAAAVRSFPAIFKRFVAHV